MSHASTERCFPAKLLRINLLIEGLLQSDLPQVYFVMNHQSVIRSVKV